MADLWKKIKNKLYTKTQNGMGRLLRENAKVLLGWREYRRLWKNGGVTGGKLYLFPWNSIGDIYILGMYYQVNTAKFREPFTLAVVGGGCFTVAEMAGFPSVVNVSQRSMNWLVRMKLSTGAAMDRVEVLHYEYVHTGIEPAITYYKGFKFIENYGIYVFGEELREGPLRNICSFGFNYEDFYRRYGIVKTKTVILAPYAKSVEVLPESLWRDIAALLANRGFTVLTNSSGESEPPVVGTRSVLFPLFAAKEILDYAGFFIGIRSGICDIISPSSCGKVILYPYMEGRFKTIQYYSLKLIPGSVNFYELEYLPDIDMQRVLSEILCSEGT